MPHSPSSNETSMKTTFLESGQILAKIKNLLESPNITEIDFAIAYLSKGGYSEIEKSLTKFLKRNGKVQFLVGLSQIYATESSALKKLLTLAQKQKNNLLEVKYHNLKGKEFHPKLVIAKLNDVTKFVIIGSSNLTHGGQKSNVEANVSVECEKTSNSENQIFIEKANSFFQYIWDAGKPLNSDIIKNYSLGEKKRRKLKATIQNKVPATKLYPFAYLDGKRKEVRHGFEVLCTDCRKSYITIPLNSFYCDDCSDGVGVIAPQPEEMDFEGKGEFEKTSIRVDGKKTVSTIVDIPCPVCAAPLNMVNDLRLWVICGDCAQKRKEHRDNVCKPFNQWDHKIEKSISYSLDENRLTKYR
jgi:HKD family nuclease